MGMAATHSEPVAWLRGLVQKKRPEPSYPRLPQVDGRGQSSVAGIYLVGELAGTPLIKLGLNAGHDVVDTIAAELPKSAPAADQLDAPLDLLIVGAGSSGLGAAARAQALGLSYVVLDAARIAQTVVDMYRGKPLFAEPAAVENRSTMWFEECTREELLERWRAQVDELQLNVHEHERVLNVQRKDGCFEVESDRDRYRARRVVLAMGKAGNPRKAGVPGEREHAARVHHTLSDPAAVQGKRVFVYGGGDVAARRRRSSLCRSTTGSRIVTIDQGVRPTRRSATSTR